MGGVRPYHGKASQVLRDYIRSGINMAQSIPTHLVISINERVLAYIKDLSAHTDIVDVLLEAVHPLGDVQMFCPDYAQYRYVLASTNCIVFGFAVGMNTVAFRLDERMKSRAISTGGIAYPECGEDWVAVVHDLPDSDWPSVDVRFWAQQAYIYARLMKARGCC